jgi:transcriptional regulator with XRE-family HTH domain
MFVFYTQLVYTLHMSTKYAPFIKALRSERGISQSVVANTLGLSRQSYMAIESGRRELSLGEFENLSAFFGVTLEDMGRGEIPDYEKYKQMILAFLRLNKNVPKTKLAKLLYFADFGWYYSHLQSMSGMPYRKIQYGPVADSYFRLIDEMFDTGEISIEQTENGAMLVAQTRSGNKTELPRLSKEEEKLIKSINEKWKGKRTADIVTFTHKQMPYLFAEDNDLVSYEVFGQENPDDIY